MNNTPEILTKLTALQPAIWQTASLTLSETLNEAISIENPLQMVMPTSQLSETYAVPQLIAQFALSSAPNHQMYVLLPQETAADFLELVAPDKSDPLEECLDDVKPLLEATIQGMCTAIGNARNDGVIPMGLSLRFSQVAPTDAMLNFDDVVVTQVAIMSDGISGTLIWVLDYEAAGQIVGTPLTDGEDAPPANPFGELVPPVNIPGSSNAANAAAGAIPPDGLELLLDIPLEVSVELGRVKMQIREVVDLGAGSIVEIDKAAGEPVDVLVNGRLVARGEVVVIEDNFGVRITEILSQQDRMQRLNEAA